MTSHTKPVTRFAVGATLLAAGVMLFLLRPGVALAHHVDLSQTTTCDSFSVEADYIGGDEARYAQVWVNGTPRSDRELPHRD